MTSSPSRQRLLSTASEAELLWAVRETAQLLGWLVYTTWSSMHSPAGYPDLTLVHPEQRRVIWAELKVQHGRVTPDQERWLTALRQAGQEAYLWRPADLDRIVTILSTREDEEEGS